MSKRQFKRDFVSHQDSEIYFDKTENIKGVYKILKEEINPILGKVVKLESV